MTSNFQPSPDDLDDVTGHMKPGPKVEADDDVEGHIKPGPK